MVYVSFIWKINSIFTSMYNKITTEQKCVDETEI